MKKIIAFLFIFILIIIPENIWGDTKMEETLLDPDIHHYLGIELNIQVWNLLSKPERDINDNNRMIAFAKGSLYHWHHSPHFKPINAQRGEWLISRVYAVLGNAQKALDHANTCYEITKDLQLDGFDLAYSYEALARAHSLIGNEEEFGNYHKLAKKAGEKIDDPENRQLFFEDLKSEPW